MRRWLFNIVCAVSMVLWVGVATLWVRSYWRWDHWSTHTASHAFADQSPRIFDKRAMRRVGSQTSRGSTVDSATGSCQVFCDYAYFEYPSAYVAADAPTTRTGREFWSSPNARDPFMKGAPISFMGFAYSYSEKKIGPTKNANPNTGKTYTFISLRVVKVPFWLAALVFAVAPTWWLVAARRGHKSESGLCPVCGYDLRATPGRCPECGAGAEVKKAG